MKTVLLIDDDHLDVENIKRIFKKAGYSVNLVAVHNGEDALSLLNGDSGRERLFPDIILLDINMPKMDGLEFLQILRNYFTFNHIKVFVTSVSTDEYDRMAAEKMGIEGFIIKPLELNKDDGKKLRQVLLTE